MNPPSLCKMSSFILSIMCSMSVSTGVLCEVVSMSVLLSSPSSFVPGRSSSCL